MTNQQDNNTQECDYEVVNQLLEKPYLTRDEALYIPEFRNAVERDELELPSDYWVVVTTSCRDITHESSSTPDPESSVGMVSWQWTENYYATIYPMDVQSVQVTEEYRTMRYNKYTRKVDRTDYPPEIRTVTRA